MTAFVVNARGWINDREVIEADTEEEATDIYVKEIMDVYCLGIEIWANEATTEEDKENALRSER